MQRMMLMVLLGVGTVATAGVENHVEAEISEERTSEVEVQIEPSLLKHTVVSEVEANFAASFDSATMALATGQRYTGAIDGKYQIELQFFGKELNSLYIDEDFAKTCKDKTVSGRYSYASQSDYLSLSIDVCALANNEFKAVRYKGYGDERKVRETFQGAIRDGQIQGTWKKKGKEAKPFVLNVVPDEFTAIEKLLFVEKVLSTDGLCALNAEGYGLYKGMPFLLNYNGSYCEFHLDYFSVNSVKTDGFYENTGGENRDKNNFTLIKQGSDTLLIWISDYAGNDYDPEISVSIYKLTGQSWKDVTKEIFPQSVESAEVKKYSNITERFDSKGFSVNALPNGLQVEGNTLVWNNGKLVLQSK